MDVMVGSCKGQRGSSQTGVATTGEVVVEFSKQL
jgi:hypothetical protein